MEALPADLVAVCARISGNDLIAAECASLTGGRPDVRGVAPCISIEHVERGAYVRQGVRVIARARSLPELVERVAASDFDATAFRIDVHDPASLFDRPSSAIVTALADVIPFGPDLSQPRHRFLVVVGVDGWLFGEVVATTDQSYRRHDDKPWTTSSSLDSRFARALVNLVPAARSILDPCCGAGSIVLEAASVGLEVIGVDWKPAMVGMTRRNLDHFHYAASASVVRDDSRRRRHAPVDAVVTDLPYGHAIDSEEATTRSIIDRSIEVAPAGVFVAHTDLTPWFEDAGYRDVEVSAVVKRAGFVRWVHLASRAAHDDSTVARHSQVH